MEQQPAAKARIFDLWVTVVALAACVGLVAARWLIAGRFWGVGYDFLGSQYEERSGEGCVTLGFLFLSYVLGGVACVACIYALARKLGGRRWIWLLLLPIAVLPLLGFHHSPSASDVPVVIRNAQPLIKALDRYRRDQGSYPTSLQDLTPIYLERIPGTELTKGRRFYYVPNGAEIDKNIGHLCRVVKDPARDPYVLAVPMMPNGTLVYRPNGDYQNLPGRDVGNGWRWTSVD